MTLVMSSLYCYFCFFVDVDVDVADAGVVVALSKAYTHFTNVRFDYSN